MSKTSKRMKQLYTTIESNKFYSVEDSIKIAQENAKAKFDETIEVCLSLGVDTRKADQNVRGMITLPHGTGKIVKVAVFAQGDKLKEAEEAGADKVGSDDLVAEIKKGHITFDRCIATPDMMPVVAQVAKLLGPKGLMPNPKLGTVTQNLKEAIENAKKGQIEFRAEKAGIIHAGIGKASFETKNLLENFQFFITAIKKAKPEASKGAYMKKCFVSSTMGPSIKIDISTL